jgi:CubicO group peptidase (beta-lactamase class C family)
MKTVIAAFLVLFFSACASQQKSAPAADSKLPWRSSSPEAQGLDPQRLSAMREWMQASGRDFRAVIIIRNGTLVMEEYFGPAGRETKQNVYSCTKSVLSALFGIAQGDGVLPPLESTALSHLSGGDVPARDDRARAVTIEQLLTMSAGIQAIRAVDMAGAKDQVRFALEKPLAMDPGTRFLYTSAGPHVLSSILQKSVGMSARDYAAKRLFAPLGIQGWTWDADGMGVTIGATNLSLSGIDLAKLGYLFLRNCDWFGTRVVPAAWVAEATRTHARVADMNRAENSGYGYLWWVDEQWGGYSAHGAGGQFVFVVPRLDLVVVFTSALSFEDFPFPWDMMKDYVLPAAGDATA